MSDLPDLVASDDDARAKPVAEEVFTKNTTAYVPYSRLIQEVSERLDVAMRCNVPKDAPDSTLESFYEGGGSNSSTTNIKTKKRTIDFTLSDMSSVAGAPPAARHGSSAVSSASVSRQPSKKTHSGAASGAVSTSSLRNKQ